MGRVQDASTGTKLRVDAPTWPNRRVRRRLGPMKLHPILAATAALLLAPFASAQTLDRVAPQVADPGDTIRLEGTNLGSVNRVRFTAVVGGFVGQWTIDVPPQSVTANAIVVQVPVFNSFTPPGATPPGELVGSVTVVSGGQPANLLDLAYLESTFGAVSTQGAPGSDPLGLAPRIEFDLFGGAPVAGNATFRPRLVDTLTSAVSVLVVGAPLTASFPQIANADVVVNFVLPLYYFPGFTPLPPANHDAAVNLPLSPSLAGTSLAMQWVSLDPLTFASAISDALVVTL